MFIRVMRESDPLSIRRWMLWHLTSHNTNDKFAWGVAGCLIHDSILPINLLHRGDTILPTINFQLENISEVRILELQG
jgi:hypothetical protein